MNHYKNKIVWVTGASSGIGESLVKHLYRYGAFVIASARRKEELERVKSEISASEDRFLILPLDLSNQYSFAEKTSQAIAWKNRMDILINNGGVSQRAFVAETTLEVERKIFEVNYFGTVELTRQVLPQMKKQHSGQIVVVSSVLGKMSIPLRSTYCSSKHALHGYFDALRAELYENGIKVTMVCPGYIKTNVSINAMKADGSNHAHMDKGQSKGMDVDKFSVKMLRKTARGREEINIGGPEIAGIYLKRFVPWLVSKVTRTMTHKS